MKNSHEINVYILKSFLLFSVHIIKSVDMPVAAEPKIRAVSNPSEVKMFVFTDKVTVKLFHLQ